MTQNPIIALIIMMLIIYLYMYINDIEIGQFFTNKGFTVYWIEKPWVVYTIMAIAVYSLLCISYQSIDQSTDRSDVTTDARKDTGKKDIEKTLGKKI